MKRKYTVTEYILFRYESYKVLNLNFHFLSKPNASYKSLNILVLLQNLLFIVWRINYRNNKYQSLINSIQ